MSILKLWFSCLFYTVCRSKYIKFLCLYNTLIAKDDKQFIVSIPGVKVKVLRDSPNIFPTTFKNWCLQIIKVITFRRLSNSGIGSKLNLKIKKHGTPWQVHLRALVLGWPSRCFHSIIICQYFTMDIMICNHAHVLLIYWHKMHVTH